MGSAHSVVIAPVGANPGARQTSAASSFDKRKEETDRVDVLRTEGITVAIALFGHA
jgi:hypothetical protein